MRRKEAAAIRASGCAAITIGDSPFEISESWGAGGNPNSIALAGISQAGFGQTVPRDFSRTLGVEFRVTAPAGAEATFGFWIDDIQLKRPPTP